jgi:hypothetical protein
MLATSAKGGGEGLLTLDVGLHLGLQVADLLAHAGHLSKPLPHLLHAQTLQAFVVHLPDTPEIYYFY